MRVSNLPSHNAPRVSIKKGIAKFDITYHALIDTNPEAQNISMAGVGEGHMLYDVTQQYSPEIFSKMRMDIDIPMQGDNMYITSINQTVVKTQRIY